MNDTPRRDVNSLLLYDVSSSFDDNNDDRHDNRDNRDQRNNRDNRDNRDNRQPNQQNDRNYNNNGNFNQRNGDNRNQQNNNGGNNNNRQNNQFEHQYNNPICKYIRNSQAAYDRDDMLNALVKKDGLLTILEDLKDWKKKDPNSNRCPSYIYQAIRNIVFASALPEAIEDVMDNCPDLSKKEFDLFMSEILVFLNESYKPKFAEINRYDEDVVASMRKAYTNILYKFNKKKVKKFKEVPGMPDAFAKQLAILSSGKNIDGSIYQVLKFLYRESSNRDDKFELSYKNILKILKIAYGKDNMPEVIKYIMLEKSSNFYKDQKTIENVWVEIDELLRNELESFDKKDIEKIIKDYVKCRKQQEVNGPIPRRFGDRRTIHPDDYPKITRVCEQLEERDFSIIQYLRNTLS